MVQADHLFTEAVIAEERDDKVLRLLLLDMLDADDVLRVRPKPGRPGDPRCIFVVSTV